MVMTGAELKMQSQVVTMKEELCPAVMVAGLKNPGKPIGKPGG